MSQKLNILKSSQKNKAYLKNYNTYVNINNLLQLIKCLKNISDG